jgi:hypothetical protein
VRPAFYDYPAEHSIHLGTTNPIASIFATVRLRQRVTKDPRLPRRRCRDGVQADRISTAGWRAVNAPHRIALVRAGAVFENGKLIERSSSDKIRLVPSGSTLRASHYQDLIAEETHASSMQPSLFVYVYVCGDRTG